MERTRDSSGVASWVLTYRHLSVVERNLLKNMFKAPSPCSTGRAILRTYFFLKKFFIIITF